MNDRNSESAEAAGAKTDGGSWLDWRDAWREMGRSEDEIAAEEAARAAAAQYVPAGTGAARKHARAARSRTWGKCDELTVKMKHRLAIISGYFLRAFKNEMMRPSWGVNGRQEMTLERLYKLATLTPTGRAHGLFEAASTATRWRDFARVIEWTRKTIQGWAKRGEWVRERAQVALEWLDGEADAPMTLPAPRHFTDTRARESFYESKKNSLYKTAPAEAGFSPLAPTPLVGAGASDSSGKAAQDRVAKWTGRTFPRRLWWLVWKHYGAFKELHYYKAVAWSGAHYVAWMKSCLAAGKRVGDLYRLYEEKLMRWHGLACDWKIRQETLHPKGLFSELYKAAAALPEYCPATPRGDRFFRRAASGGDRGAKKEGSQRAGEAKTQNVRRRGGDGRRA